ncbi:MAG: hypothetical protein HYS35_02145 [Betaproteobacteria bacterium]|nr:hypothetical protein [Betaproteobacteria bacterium]
MVAPALDRFTIIVRHCGERTTEACAQLLQALAPGNKIHRVSAQPFQEALRQSLELGIAEGRPWTLCIDADVLVLPGLAGFLAAVDGFPSGFFEAQALVLDKLLPARRPAGNHLYRTELIARALPRIPAGKSLRPESDMILAMAGMGYRAHQSALLVGLHDFEQAYDDIYLKAFLHAHKHRFLAPLLRPLWEALGREDDDFRVALMALEDGLQHGPGPEVSRSFRRERVQGALAVLSLAPKKPLAAVTPAQVSAMLRTAAAKPGGGMRSLVEEIQTKIDAAVFPSLAARGAALLAGFLAGLSWRRNR